MEGQIEGQVEHETDTSVSRSRSFLDIILRI